MPLVGRYHQKMDSRGLLLIPQKFIQELGESFMLAKNPRGCLSLIPQNEWSQLLKCFTPLSGADKKNCRFIIANAVESVADKYGRIIIPTELRYYAKLDEDCIAVIIGTFNKVEIWNSSLYAVMTKS